MKKYGKENFSFEVLEHVEDIELLISREQFWIDKFRAEGKILYNIALIAGSSLGIKRSEKTRSLLRKPCPENCLCGRHKPPVNKGKPGWNRGKPGTMLGKVCLKDCKCGKHKPAWNRGLLRKCPEGCMCGLHKGHVAWNKKTTTNSMVGVFLEKQNGARQEFMSFVK